MRRFIYGDCKVADEMSRIVLIFIALLSCFDSICESAKKTVVGKLSSTQKQVEAIYSRVAPCLELTPTLNHQLLSYNADLESHWKEILLVTDQYRHLPPHNGSYYAGTIAGTQIRRDNAIVKTSGIDSCDSR